MFFYNFNLSHNAIVNHHQQEYQHQYAREKHRLVGEPRVQITIVEDVAAGTNIARTILLATTMRKYPRSI
jgi:hypothetical protein